ncbi:MAG: pseudouridine synthase, partial [Emcibacteraceae bacterium]|nr:pseudouridine synthase [Emcibacteraceae bacterium]
SLIVHRLDMDTSGLIVLGRTKFSHRHLSLQFQNKNVDKIYIAHVFGSPSQDEGMIDLPLICDWPNRPKQMVDHEKGKPSQTKWRVLERDDVGARLELTPLTGRSHQIRVHMLSMGHPILGDRFYAHEEALNASDRLRLHSKTITIMHPIKKEKITFDSDVHF